MYTLHDFEELATRKFPEAFDNLRQVNKLTFEDVELEGYHTKKLNVGFVRDEDDELSRVWLLLKLPDVFEFYKDGEDTKLSREDEDKFEPYMPFKMMPKHEDFTWGALCWPVAAYFFLADGRLEFIGQRRGIISPELFQSACMVLAEKMDDAEYKDLLSGAKATMSKFLAYYDEEDPEGGEEIRKYCRLLFGHDNYAD
jgi:hypothetical protein